MVVLCVRICSLSTKTGPFSGRSSDLRTGRTKGTAGICPLASRRLVLFSGGLFLGLDELVEVADVQLLDHLHPEVLTNGLQHARVALAVLVHDPVDVRLFYERVRDLAACARRELGRGRRPVEALPIALRVVPLGDLSGLLNRPYDGVGQQLLANARY